MTDSRSFPSSLDRALESRNPSPASSVNLYRQLVPSAVGIICSANPGVAASVVSASSNIFGIMETETMRIKNQATVKVVQVLPACGLKKFEVRKRDAWATVRHAMSG